MITATCFFSSYPKLTFKTGASSTEGLEGLEITCETCHARATLKGAFDKGKLEALDRKYAGEYHFMCKGQHPWKHKREGCDLYPRVLQRGSSSVYFPVISSSLVIPPYSSMLRIKLEMLTTLSDDDCLAILRGRFGSQAKIKRPKKELASVLNSIGSLEP